MTAHNILERAAQHMRGRASTYDKPEGERSMGTKPLSVFMSEMWPSLFSTSFEDFYHA